MPLSGEDIARLANPFHAYMFGTSFWYALRGFCRVVSPSTVADWFRPPIQQAQPTTDLELYTIWTDGWQLLVLALILLIMADAVPLPSAFVGSSLTRNASPESKRPYARAVIAVTILHHVLTGIGAYTHWANPDFRTRAMDIGVFGNVFLTVAGAVALATGPLAVQAEEQSAVGRKKKA